MVNETYERYRFSKLIQDRDVHFDIYLAEICHLADSCHFEGVEELMLRNRIIIEAATHHKLVQVHNLTLKQAIDICNASDDASWQLEVMSTPDEVLLLQSVKSPHCGGGCSASD